MPEYIIVILCLQSYSQTEAKSNCTLFARTPTVLFYYQAKTDGDEAFRIYFLAYAYTVLQQICNGTAQTANIKIKY